ncbi:MAG: phosphate acyltransferase PlsX [Clostridia bacterium]|nr:phosphate acyltransferase PlsX [Clostridia bacterium]
MRIVVDAYGGDHAPTEVVRGALMAVRELENVELIFTGKEEELLALLKEETYPEERVSIRNATEVITNDDSPVQATRTKKDSSLMVALSILKNKEADAMVSAGNTGAYFAGAFRVLGRIKGVKRPALATFIPTLTGGSILLDVGANTDCKPEHLLQFAEMGAVYAEDVLKIKNPRVGIVNIGAEEAKGDELSKAAHQLLKTSKVNFVGNIEARQVPAGDADVIVCDGFVGNVIIKLMEGMASSMFGMIKNVFMKNILTKLCAAVLKPGLGEVKKKADYSEYGGAPILGIDAAVIKAHGSSKAKAFYNAVKSAANFAESGAMEKLRQRFHQEEETHEC